MVHKKNSIRLNKNKNLTWCGNTNHHTRGETYFRIFLYQFKPNLNCNYTFRIDLVPDGIDCSTKLIQKVQVQFIFGLIFKDSKIDIRGCGDDWAEND